MGVAASLLIGGRREPGEGDSYPIRNPARPAEVVGSAPAASFRQVDAAVVAAQVASADWATTPPAARAKALVAATSAASRQAVDRDLATLYTREHGKVRTESSFEFEAAPLIAEVLGAMADAALAPEHLQPGMSYPRLQREPFGVAALVLPFNWPVSLAMTKLTSALVAGNTAVVKVPPSCPLAVLEFAAALAEQLPAGVVNVVCAAGVDVAAHLVGHRDVGAVSLTGGVTTGRAVMAHAAANLTPVLLELGGNDAAIVCPDIAITDSLADRITTAAFTTAGQVCMAIKRLLVPRERRDDVVAALLDRCASEVVGDGLAEDSTIGPMHTAAGYERVRSMCDEAVRGGAVLHPGGSLREADRDSGGYFMLPTFATDVPPDCTLVRDEQFGPVLPVIGYDDLDDAVAIANATDFGLTASVWTADDGLAAQVANRLIAGTISVNCHGMAAQDPRLPFGGTGLSGIGRELGVDGIRAFTQPRSFVSQPPPS